MLKYLLPLLFLLPLSAVAGDGVALPQPARVALEQVFSGKTPGAVAEIPLENMYEVVYGNRIFYISGDGNYLLNGELIDLKQQRNLTEERRQAGRLRLLDTLDEAGMIRYPADGETRHVVTVFTDIDCTYCRKLHSGMAEMNDLGIEVRYLAFPRAGLSSPSYDKAVAVWCAEERNSAMDRAKADKPVPPAQCDNPVAEHMAVGQQMGVNGTPALLLADGRLLPGYVPPDRLRRMLDEGRAPQ